MIFHFLSTIYDVTLQQDFICLHFVREEVKPCGHQEVKTQRSNLFCRQTAEVRSRNNQYVFYLMTKVKVVGLRPSLTFLQSTAETLQPVTGSHESSDRLAGNPGADPLGSRIRTCLKILQATEAEESVSSSCVYTGRCPDGVAGTYLVLLLQSVSRTGVEKTCVVFMRCRPAGPHQDQRPEQNHKLLHLPRGTLHRSS